MNTILYLELYLSHLTPSLRISADSSFSISRCSFIGLSSNSNGYAIYISQTNSDAAISDCAFVSNRCSTNSEGSIFLESKSSKISCTLFYNCSSITVPTTSIYCSTLSQHNYSSFLNNRASQIYGSYYNNGDYLTHLNFSNCYSPRVSAFRTSGETLPSYIYYLNVVSSSGGEDCVHITRSTMDYCNILKSSYSYTYGTIRLAYNDCVLSNICFFENSGNGYVSSTGCVASVTKFYTDGQKSEFSYFNFGANCYFSLSTKTSFMFDYEICILMKNNPLFYSFSTKRNTLNSIIVISLFYEF